MGDGGHHADLLHELLVLGRVRAVRQYLYGHRDLHLLALVLRDPQALVDRPERARPDDPAPPNLVLADEDQLGEIWKGIWVLLQGLIIKEELIIIMDNVGIIIGSDRASGFSCRCCKLIMAKF